MERVLVRPFKTTVWSVPYLVDDMEKESDENAKHIKKYRAVFAQGRGVAWPKEATFNARHGFAVTSAEQWALEHLGKARRAE